MERKGLNSKLKRVLALLLAVALVVGNAVTGFNPVSAFADGITWSSDQAEDADLYDSVAALYTTDAGGLSIDNQEVWSKGSDDDVSVEFDAPVYADDYSSAEVRVIVTPRDKYVKITGVRQAGYFGEGSIATASNASIATVSDANYAVNASEYIFTVYNNSPAFIVYYTVDEDEEGAALVQEETVAPTEQATVVEETTTAIEETSVSEETSAVDETAVEETVAEDTTVAETAVEDTTTAETAAPETEAETEAPEETEAPVEQPTALRIIDSVFGVITARAEEMEAASTQEYVWVVADEDVTEIGVIATAIMPMSLEEPKGGISIVNTDWDALSQDGDGNYEYNLIGDTDSVFTMTYPNSLYTEQEVTLTFHTPKYGMEFADSNIDSIIDGTKVLDAYFEKDENGNNTTMVIVADGSKIVGVYNPGTDQSAADENAANSWFLEIATQYVPLTDAQCAEIIANGYEASVFSVEAVGEGGDVLADNYDYKAIPAAGTDTQISSLEHEKLTSYIAYWANYGYGSLVGRDNQVHNGSDFVNFSVPTASSTGNNLVELGPIKIYKPDDRFTLDGFGNGLSWPQYNAGENLEQYDRYLMNYYNWDKTEYTDSDGTYYLLTPKKPLYNNGTDTLKGDITYGARVFWLITDDLEADTKYTAPDMKFELTTVGGGTDNQTGYGTVYNTMKAAIENTFAWLPVGEYKLIDDTTVAKFIPGADYSRKSFVYMRNYDRYNSTTNTLTATVKGIVTEQYDFPYEIQPTYWQYQSSSGNETINSVTYTVTKADGTTEEYTKAINKEYPSAHSFYSGDDGVYVDFTENLSTGDRVSKVIVEWGAIRQYPSHRLTDAFDYHVAETHEDGTPFTEGELVHIEYSSQLHEDDNRTYEDAKVVPGFNVAYDTTKYLYLSCGSVNCPLLDMDMSRVPGSGEAGLGGVFLDGHEYYLGDMYFKGLSGGQVSHSVDNPVIELNVKAHNIFGLDDPTSMISGNMTLTQNMSGWKMEYTLHNVDDGTETSKTYTIPELSGDTELTRADLGMSDSDRFTGSIKFSYDGTFTYKEYKEQVLPEHGIWTSNGTPGDNTPAGTYDIAYMIKGIRMMAYTTALDGTELQTLLELHRGDWCNPDTDTSTTDYSTLKLAATYKHDGACSDPQHATEDGKVVTHGTGNGYTAAPWTNVFRNREYITSGPNFTGTLQNTVMQGGNATATVKFALIPAPKTWYTHNAHKTMPTDVPEAIYIQLIDDQFSIDTSDPAFIASLTAHGMTAQDVSIVTGAGDTKWVKLDTAGANAKFAPQIKTATTWNNSFTIAVNTWVGADTTAPHNPFGKVYYDISNLLTKYDGSLESGLVKDTFEGAVADEYGLLGDGDTTTERLWYGDMTSTPITVTANAFTGVNIIPVKDNKVYSIGSTSWEPDEANLLVAKQTIVSPNMPLENYEVITYIPKKGDITKYSINNVEYEKENEYSLYLTGPVSTTNTTGGSTPVYSYSKDGVTYVPESSIGASEWGEYRYIKTNVAIMYVFANIETSIPLKGDQKTGVGDFHDYVSATYTFDGMVDPQGNKRYSKANMAEYIQTDFIMRGPAGSIWYDVNEDGYNNNGELPAGEEITLNLYSPKINLNLGSGTQVAANTLISSTTVNADGSYELRSYMANAGQQLEIIMPDKQTVVTQKTSTTDPTIAADDSDMVRDLKLFHPNGVHAGGINVAYMELPKLPKPMLENVGCGLVKLPTIASDHVWVHVGETVGPNAGNPVATTQNPNNEHPEVSYFEGIVDHNDGFGPWMTIDDEGNLAGYKTMDGWIQVLNTFNTLQDQSVEKLYFTIYNNVQYDANGATSGTVPTDDTKYYPSDDDADSDKVVLKDSNGLTRTGYTFLGWNEDPDADTAISDFHAVNRTEDITLYAIWSINDYKVSFDMNHADTAQYDDIEVTYNSQINADAEFPADPSRHGYTFADWAYSDATNGATLSDADMMPANEISLTAQWTANTYNVKYDSNGGNGTAMSDSSFTYDAADNTVKANTYTAQPGYHFIGWNTDATANTARYSDTTGAAQTLTVAQTNALYDEFQGADVTLYAIWVEDDNIDISYESEDATQGYVTVTTESLPPATGVAAGSEAVAETGYTFIEWEMTTAGMPVATPTDAIIIPQKNAQGLNVSGTYTAKFKENAYTITFDKNGADGTETMPEQNFMYTDDKKLDKNLYTNSGMKFVGWSTTADGTGTKYTDEEMVSKLTAVDGEEITLYAIWEDVKASITQDPPIKKIVSLKTGSAGIVATEDTVYKFQMKPDPSDAPMPTAVAGVTELQTDGSLIASITGAQAATYGVEFGIMTYTKPGTYSYTLSEIKGTNTHFTYDENTYTMTVVISWEDAARTKLQKAVTYTKSDGTVVDTMEFTNVYERRTGGGNGGNDDGTRHAASGSGSSINTSVTGGITEIGPDGTPLGNMIMGGLPKTGEEWMMLFAIMASITGIMGLLVLMLRRRDTDK